jgi:hypothetical protein
VGKFSFFFYIFFLNLNFHFVCCFFFSLADSIDYYSFSFVLSLSAVCMCVITSITWFLLIADFGSNIISLNLFLISRNNIMRTIYTQSIQFYFALSLTLLFVLHITFSPRSEIISFWIYKNIFSSLSLAFLRNII